MYILKYMWPRKAIESTNDGSGTCFKSAFLEENTKNRPDWFNQRKWKSWKNLVVPIY